MFQSGYPGAKTVEDVKTVSVEVEQLGFGLTPKWHTPKLPRPGDDVATDIQRVVATLKSAAAMAGIPQPRKPWLSELAPTYDISELKQRRDSELVLGVLDAPAEQDQITEYFCPIRKAISPTTEHRVPARRKRFGRWPSRQRSLLIPDLLRCTDSTSRAAAST